jgi:HSP20 family protein
MHLKEILPWNWGKKSVPIHRGAEHGAGALEPLQPVGALQHSVNRLFDDFVHDFPRLGRVPGFGVEPLGGSESAFLPALDATETDEGYTVTLELPGLDEKDVDVSLRDDAVTIRGEKSERTERDENGAHWVERRYGSFRRVVPLPAAVEADAVTATFQKGVLTLTLPKAESAKVEARSIPIDT